MKKIQVPVLGGLRKKVNITGSGLTLQGYENATLTLAQLAGLLGVVPAAPTLPNTQAKTAPAYLTVGPGLQGGGALIGNVPLNLALGTIPSGSGWGEDPEDGEPGVPGQPGVAGAAGPQGPPGPALLWAEADMAEDVLPIPGNPGAAGPQGNPGSAGPTGPQGVAGYPIMLSPDDPDDPREIPGVAGAAGAPGAAGPAGPSGAFPFYLWPDDPDDILLIPGATGATGPSGATGGGTAVPNGMNLVPPGILTSTVSSWQNYTAIAKIGGANLLRYANNWQFNFKVSSGTAVIGAATVMQVAVGTTTPVLSSTIVSWGGNPTPSLTTGQNLCDEISVAITPAYDYYIAVWLTTAASNSSVALATATGLSSTPVSLLGGYNSGNTTGAVSGTYSSLLYAITEAVTDNDTTASIPGATGAAGPVGVPAWFPADSDQGEDPPPNYGVPAPPVVTNVAFVAGNFTGNGSMTWTVTSAQQNTFAYTLVGNLMTVFFSIVGGTVGGTVNSILQMTIPAGKKSTFTVLNGCNIENNSVYAQTACQVNPGGSTITCYANAGGTVNWTAGAVSVYGQITFPVD